MIALPKLAVSERPAVGGRDDDVAKRPARLDRIERVARDKRERGLRWIARQPQIALIGDFDLTHAIVKALPQRQFDDQRVADGDFMPKTEGGGAGRGGDRAWPPVPAF